MERRADVIIVGGGVIGLLTARELVREGLAVTLLERGPVGKESSQAGGGILSPIPPWDAPPAVSALATASYPEFPRLAASLQQSTGIDIEYDATGVMLLGNDVIPAAAGDWAVLTGQPLEILDTAGLRAAEPAIHPQWQAALLMPNLAQLRNPLLTRALHEDLQLAGVVVSAHTEVTRFLQDSGRVTGVDTARGQFMAATVIVAAGAWTASLLQGIATLPIVPVRGQMLWYRVAPGRIRHVLIDEEQYVIPRRDGVCLVGSTVEDAGFDKRTTRAAAAGLAAAAARIVPAFEGLTPAGQWSGLRPGSPAGIPFISAHPRLAGLFVNAGHFRNGINLAPASARLVADLVLERPPAVDPDPYRLQNHANHL